MIYTCTCNPSLDYYLNFDEVNPGITNRSNSESFQAGGKGINVSLALDRLKIKSCALGFLGGFTKDYYLSFLYAYKYLQPLFVTIKDNTRIDIKIQAKQETSLNAVGPKISKEEFLKFKSRIEKLFPGDILVVSGNIQEEIEDDMISLINEIAKEGINVVIDTNIKIINGCLNSPIKLIRIDDEDVKDDVLNVAKDIHEKSNADVIYYGNDGRCIFVGDKIYESNTLTKYNKVGFGIGDSMVAGYLYSLSKGANFIESIKYSLATALININGYEDDYINELNNIYNEIEVNEIL